MMTIQDLEQRTSELVTAGAVRRQAICDKLAALSPHLPPSVPLFSVPLKDGTNLYMRRLDLATAVRLTFGVPSKQSLPSLIQQYFGPGWSDPQTDLFRTTVVAADRNQYHTESQFEFSTVITDRDATKAIALQLVNADSEGLYARLMVVDERYRSHNLGFTLLAWQAEYASCYGRPGAMAHKRPVELLKHKGLATSVPIKLLLVAVGYGPFAQDPNDPGFWQVATPPVTVLQRVKELGYIETEVYF